MWRKLRQAIQVIYISFAKSAKIKKVSPANGVNSYINSKPKSFNLFLAKIPKPKADWAYIGTRITSAILIFFGGIIIADTVIRFFTHIYMAICVWKSLGVNSFIIDKCNKGAITTNILKLSDNILIAYTILFAGLLLFKLSEEWEKTKGDTTKLDVLLHGIDKAILSMVTIALSINFLIIVLTNISNNGTQGDTFYTGINIACIIIAIAIYIYLTRTREYETRPRKDKTHTPKNKPHAGGESQESTDANPDK